MSPWGGRVEHVQQYHFVTLVPPALHSVIRSRTKDKIYMNLARGNGQLHPMSLTVETAQDQPALFRDLTQHLDPQSVGWVSITVVKREEQLVSKFVITSDFPDPEYGHLGELCKVYIPSGTEHGSVHCWLPRSECSVSTDIDLHI